MPKIFKVDNKHVAVYDDVFSYQENLQIYADICQQPYIRSNLDNNFGNNKDADIKWSYLIPENSSLSNLITPRYLNFNEFKNKKITVFRQYVNFSTSTTVDVIHTDSPANTPKSFTILHYANFSWDKNWHGETVFYNSTADEIEFSTMIKPGRVVVFDSNIPHSARAPSSLADYARYTIATKLIINNE